MAANNWLNTTADGKASTAGNWSLARVPTGTDVATFSVLSNTPCTFDAGLSSYSFAGITFTSAYTALLAAASGVAITLTGDFTPVSQSVFTLGSGATWNCAGSWDPNTVATPAQCNYAGATLNLSGVGKTAGFISSSSASPLGVVNVLLGASYDQENGDFCGIQLNNYGTITSTAELNIERVPATGMSGTTQVYNHSTGVFSGAGTIIFSNGALFSNLGTVSIKFGAIQYAEGYCMAIEPGTWQFPLFTIYLQGVGPSLQVLHTLPGTYNFTNTGGAWNMQDDTPGSYTYHVDNSAGAVFNISMSSVSFASGSGGLQAWVPGVGGQLVFSNAAVTLASNNLLLDTIVVPSGGGLTIQDNSSPVGIIVQAGGSLTLAAGITLTVRDQFTVQPGGSLTIGDNQTWNIQGCLDLRGVSGTPLVLHPATALAIAFTGSSPNTANADYVSLQNVTVTGLTLQASHSTNVSGNSGVNFSPAVNRPVNQVVVTSPAQTLASGNRELIRTPLGSNNFLFGIDTPLPVLSPVPMAAYSGIGNYGCAGYYDGTWQQACTLDNFNVYNPGSYNPYAGYLVVDFFQDVLRTPIASHTMNLGGGYTVPQGAVQIGYNYAQIIATASGHIVGGQCVWDSTHADSTLSFTINFGAITAVATSGGNIYVAVRMTDNDNLWLIGFEGSNTRCVLYKTIANAYTLEENVAYTFANNTDYAIKIVLSAATITMSINGVQQFSYTSATFNQTATLMSFIGQGVGQRMAQLLVYAT